MLKIQTVLQIVVSAAAFLFLGCGAAPTPQIIEADTTTPVALPTAAAAPVHPVGQPAKGWELVFSDEFENDGLDTSKWVTCYWWNNNGCTNASNNELQWYQADDVIVSDGVLKLQARERSVDASDGNQYAYTSGMVTTGRDYYVTSDPAKFAFQFGYAEARARVPKGQGLWPAFWLLPASHNSKPEIDVMEILGHETGTVHFNFHYLNSEGVYRNPGSEWNGPDFSAGWHTFAVDWQPDVIIWYVDGQERWRLTNIEAIPTQPMYLLLNLAVGGVWPGSPDDTTAFPAEYFVDYVRVWHRKNLVYLPLIADTYVDERTGSKNFGHHQTLQVDGAPDKIAYLGFDTTALAGKTIVSAKLRLNTVSQPSSGSSNIHTVRLVAQTWDERTVTYETRPDLQPEILGQISNISAGSTYDIPLDATQLQPRLGGQLFLALDSDGEDGVDFYSRESLRGQPFLVVTTS